MIIKINSPVLTSAGQRFKYFCDILGLAPTNIAKLLGLKEKTMLYQIYNGRMRVDNFSENIYDMGCNLNWLKTGKGAMFADNEQGQYLKEQLEEKHRFEREVLFGEKQDQSNVPSLDGSDLMYNHNKEVIRNGQAAINHMFSDKHEKIRAGNIAEDQEKENSK